jgi:recombinational DNA repair protein RecR
MRIIEQDATKKSNRRSKCVVEDACKFCKETLREDDQMVICEHCDDFICSSCAKLSSEEYFFLQKTETFYWFCSDCEKPTLRARKSEKQMEEKWLALFAAFRAEMENNYRKEMSTFSNLVGSLSNELSSLRKELIEERAQRRNTKNSEKMELKNHNFVIAEVSSESSSELLDRT